MKLLFSLFFVFPVTFCLYSQQQASTPDFTIPDERYTELIKDVYGPDYPPANTGLKEELIHLLRDRIQVVDASICPGKDFPLLTSLPLMNETNTLIQPFVPGSYDVSTFNPLHYGFNFFDTRDQWFRIDGSEYFLFVKSCTR